MADEVKREAISDKSIRIGPPGVLRVTLALSPAPDEAWRAFFLQPFSSFFTWTSKPGYTHLAIHRGSVEFLTTEATLEAALRTIDARIAGTNKWYITDFLAELGLRNKAEEEREREHEADMIRILGKFRGK